MRRADKAQDGSVVIRVREGCGTYIATGGGKRASCTASPYSAAFALARKIGLKPGFAMVEHGTGANRFYRAEVAR